MKPRATPNPQDFDKTLQDYHHALLELFQSLESWHRSLHDWHSSLQSWHRSLQDCALKLKVPHHPHSPPPTNPNHRRP
jgi:hypothetical protein